MSVKLFTFDFFGTVVDWRAGLRADLRRLGHALTDQQFDEVIDAQASAESAAFRPYADIVAESLVNVLHLPRESARTIGENAGTWLLFPEAGQALRQLMQIAPCAAMTNSDRNHGVQVQKNLGFALSHWFCAEDLRIYKPARAFWEEVADRLGIRPGPDWWHVSAYADYDLDTANEFGLTTVFVRRPHSRVGSSNHAFADLLEMEAYCREGSV